MKTATKGNIGEAAVLNALVDHDLHVLVPFGGGHPFDLVVHLEGATFLRIQCKTGWSRGGCMSFNSHSTDHGRGAQSYLGLADLFGVYFPPTKAVYLVPVGSVGRHEGRLRFEPTRNNQQAGVRYAVDYEIDRWSRDALLELITSPQPALLDAA
jgi:hypothetical protein